MCPDFLALRGMGYLQDASFLKEMMRQLRNIAVSDNSLHFIIFVGNRQRCIGDSPHNVGANQDDYPLMESFVRYKLKTFQGTS